MRCRCGEHVESGRERLGISKCLACGEAEAMVERATKAKRVSLAYPKGPYMYMGGNEDAKRNLNDSTDRRRATEVAEILPVRVARELNRAPTKERARAIGVYFLSGEPNGVFYFDENDPNLKKASRRMRFDGK